MLVVDPGESLVGGDELRAVLPLGHGALWAWQVGLADAREALHECWIGRFLLWTAACGGEDPARKLGVLRRGLRSEGSVPNSVPITEYVKSCEFCGCCGDRQARPWVMGILNVTPDSFSDGGTYLEVRSPRRSGPLHNPARVFVAAAPSIGMRSTHDPAEPSTPDGQTALA